MKNLSINKANVNFLFRETKKCWTHSDCPSHLRCTNGYCGDPTYFKTLQERPCKEDKQCEVNLDMLRFENLSALLFRNCWLVRCAAMTLQLLISGSLARMGSRRSVATILQDHQSSGLAVIWDSGRWKRWLLFAEEFLGNTYILGPLLFVCLSFLLHSIS